MHETLAAWLVVNDARHALRAVLLGNLDLCSNPSRDSARKRRVFNAPGDYGYVEGYCGLRTMRQVHGDVSSRDATRLAFPSQSVSLVTVLVRRWPALA